jgi:hypothetical protein
LSGVGKRGLRLGIAGVGWRCIFWDYADLRL